MPTAPIVVAIAGDRSLVSFGLTAMLEPFVDRARVVDLLADFVAPEPLDVALFDPHEPDTPASGLLVSQVLGRTRASAVVAYSWSMRRDHVDRALGEGASGYLSKRLSARETLAALEQIVAGQVTVAGEIAEISAGGLPAWNLQRWPGQEAGLTEREAEVLAWIVRGLRNDDIGDKVFLSINTIKTHIRMTYRKIGVKTRSQAVIWAVDHGFTRVAPPLSTEDIL